MSRIISILIALLAALFPIFLIHSVSYVIAIVADLILLFVTLAMHHDLPKDEGVAITLVAVLVSVISQIAWVLLT